MDNADTIVALSTPPGEGGIGIIRISGDEAFNIAREIFRLPGLKKLPFPPKNKYLYYGYIITSKGEIIDEVLMSCMKKPHTFTREDVVEINAHGGSLPLRKIINLALEKGARLAEPGEFTKRAFLNGRIDLAQAEAVLKIIRARSEKGLQAAVNLAKGSLSRKVEELRKQLVQLIIEIEAQVDFPEEETLQGQGQLQEYLGVINSIVLEIKKILQTADLGRIYTEGAATAIVGRPNVGKSSLLNALVGKDRAIVTDIPGTTRDVLEEMVNVRGIPLKILDTAGLRKKAGKIEQLGMEKTKEAINSADLILLMFDSSRPLTEEDLWIYKLVRGRGDKKVLVIFNKIDLAKKGAVEKFSLPDDISELQSVYLSLKTGQGLDELLLKIEELLFEGGMPPVEEIMVTGLRQEQALRGAYEALLEADRALRNGLPEDIVAIDLYRARQKLGEITGAEVDEEILDGIFSQFCVGK